MGERARLRQEERRREHHVHRRRWLIWTVVGVVLGVALVVGGPWVYAQYLVQHTPDPLALDGSGSEQIPVGPVEIDGTWEVQPGSEAGYRLDEVLSGQDVTVVGRTQSVSGTVVVAGGRLTEALIAVGVDTITSEQAARDAYFWRALDTTEYPQATFQILESIDVSAIGESAATVTVEARGQLTMHGVTRDVVATLEVRRTSVGIEVAALVPVVLADFDLPTPDLGWVVVEPEGLVEALLLFSG